MCRLMLLLVNKLWFSLKIGMDIDLNRGEDDESPAR